MLTPPSGRPHSQPLINVCPKCAEQNLRSVMTATPQQVAAGHVTCPLHGVMKVSELKQDRQ